MPWRLAGSAAPLLGLYIEEYVTSLRWRGSLISLLKLDEMKRYPKALCDMAAGRSF